MTKYSLENKKIIIATHTRFATGPSEELERFLKDKCRELVYIAHPFSYCTYRRSFVNIYKFGIRVKKINAPLIKGIDLIYFLKDIILNLFYSIILFSKFDIFIGINNLNAFCGIILNKIGIVDKVIFYTIDYVPRRFKNNILNRMYHLVDKFCCYNATCVWNLSSRMEEARYRNSISKNKSAPQLVVPNGSNFYQIKRHQFSEISRYSMVHMGHLLKKQGIQLLIDALPEIIKRFPNANLLIIGNGPFEQELRAQVKRLNLENYVRFMGFIEDHNELERILAKCAIGIATYTLDPDNYSYFADPGKPKTYLAVGLPVIITNVPAVAAEIQNRKAGIVIEYSEEQLVNAVITLLSNDTLYKEYRQNAIAFGSLFDWNNIFQDAFKNTLAVISSEVG